MLQSLCAKPKTLPSPSRTEAGFAGDLDLREPACAARTVAALLRQRRLDAEERAALTEAAQRLHSDWAIADGAAPLVGCAACLLSLSSPVCHLATVRGHW